MTRLNRFDTEVNQVRTEATSTAAEIAVEGVVLGVLFPGELCPQTAELTD